MIEFQHVTKTYKKNIHALKNINLKIDEGDFVFLVGPSGAGKSTFIKLLLREEKTTHGNILINDIDITKLPKRKIPKLRRSIGIIFQDFRLLNNKTVYENVAFAMEILEIKRKYIKKQVPMVLDLVGLNGKGDKYPNELSGGEMQRVSIARAIVNNPDLLIADEPTGNLDPDTAWDIMRILRYINRRGTTIIMATHAKDIVDVMQQRVIAIESGKIIRDDKRGVYGYED